MPMRNRLQDVFMHAFVGNVALYKNGNPMNYQSQSPFGGQACLATGRDSAGIDYLESFHYCFDCLLLPGPPLRMQIVYL